MITEGHRNSTAYSDEDGHELPTEEERLTLRRVSGPIAATAFLVGIIEFAERFCPSPSLVAPWPRADRGGSVLRSVGGLYQLFAATVAAGFAHRSRRGRWSVRSARARPASRYRAHHLSCRSPRPRLSSHRLTSCSAILGLHDPALWCAVRSSSWLGGAHECLAGAYIADALIGRYNTISMGSESSPARLLQVARLIVAGQMPSRSSATSS